MPKHLQIDRDELTDFCRRHKIAKLSLFGSVLHDNFGPNSDIDVLVEFQPAAKIGFLALTRLTRELSEMLGRKVDLVPAEGLKPRIRDAVLAHTEVLFAA